jgi:hypothetical protein
MIWWIKLFNRLFLWLMGKTAKEVQLDIWADLSLAGHICKVEIHDYNYDSISVDVIYDKEKDLEEELNIIKIVNQTETRRKVYIKPVIWTKEQYNIARRVGKVIH